MEDMIAAAPEDMGIPIHHMAADMNPGMVRAIREGVG